MLIVYYERRFWSPQRRYTKSQRSRVWIGNHQPGALLDSHIPTYLSTKLHVILCYNIHCFAQNTASFLVLRECVFEYVGA